MSLLFCFLFISFSFSCLFMSILMLEYNSVTVEFFYPVSSFLEFPFVFVFDYISLFFFSSVSIISGVVFLYSRFYMAAHPSSVNLYNNRFFMLLFLFVFSMFLLVFSGSWVVAMVGWDGLGLVSFLLVIFYNSPSSLDSGLVTIFTNRVGDCFFLLSFMFFFYSGWLCLDFLSYTSSFFFLLIFLLGCITKSAQIPFSSWLPAAMAAPTPVSSLVHSSTLVTAGVYLMVRFNYLFFSVYSVLVVISLFTMSLAGVCALVELDFKKVVAMSTLSQLGFMIFSLSMGFYLFSFMHMIFHAFFKSSLFLSTGSLMHHLSGSQDSREFGSLGSSYFSKLFFSMSCLSLVGFPFSLGFYSKDTILSSLSSFSSALIMFLFVLSCCFTVSYTLRLLWVGFFFFPSFPSSLSFYEDCFFFFPVLLLYNYCLFSGNLFFYYFISPMFLSFLEASFGVVLIILGALLFYVFNYSYFFLYLSSTISFLSIFTTSTVSNFMDKFSYSFDYSWSELFSGEGIFLYMKKINYMSISLWEVKIMAIVVFTTFILLL